VIIYILLFNNKYYGKKSKEKAGSSDLNKNKNDVFISYCIFITFCYSVLKKSNIKATVVWGLGGDCEDLLVVDFFRWDQGRSCWWVGY